MSAPTTDSNKSDSKVKDVKKDGVKKSTLGRCLHMVTCAVCTT